MNKEVPGNEEDLALLTIVNGDKIKIENSITAIIGREGSSKIIIAFTGATDFIDHDGS